MPDYNDPELAALMLELMRLESGSGRAEGQVPSGKASMMQLEMMRQMSPQGRAQGEMLPDDMRELSDAMSKFQRKRLSPEQIHNYGALYGEPLTEAQLNWHEDRLNAGDKSYYGEFPPYPR